MAKIHNLAFDYSAYDREVKREDEKRIRHRLNKALLKNKGSMVVFIGGAIVVMAMLLAMLAGKVQLSGLYEERSLREAELTQILNENTSLKSEIDSKTGLSKVEEYAEKELGLKKLDKSQIEYVEVPKDTVAEIVKPKDESVFVKLKNWFSNALEYIGAK